MDTNETKPVGPEVTKVTTEVPVNSRHDLYHEVATVLNNGAFAVLVAFCVILWVARGFITKVTNSQAELLDTLQKSVRNNTAALDSMQRNNQRVVDLLVEFRHSAYVTKLIEELKRRVDDPDEP